MFLSIIICTYRRVDALQNLLSCLATQTHRDFEVLIVDGSGKDGGPRSAVEAFRELFKDRFDLSYITSTPGLTRQRNIGLRAARGDIICFFDDDITFGEDFLSQAVALFDREGMDDVGGIGGYDTLHCPTPISWRWRLRRWIRIVPSLKPGDADHLGRNVSAGFLAPDQELWPAKWLSGYCQIFRRSAISDLLFDEVLPTYGGEDRDFSMNVARHWRLLMCPSLQIKHHISPAGRASSVNRMWQSGFGMGRSFAKRRKSRADGLTIMHWMLGEFLIDLIGAMFNPSLLAFRLALARQSGAIAGLRSFSDRQITNRH
jgi:glycosyltransferase involved in cell wall biosynthesis